MKTARLKLISALVPYVAVVIGLYILENAWIAIGLYHFGIAVFLIAGDRNSLLKRYCRDSQEAAKWRNQGCVA